MPILFLLCAILLFMGIMLIRKIDDRGEKTFGWTVVIGSVIGTLGNFCLIIASDRDDDGLFSYGLLHISVCTTAFIVNRVYTHSPNFPRSAFNGPMFRRPETFVATALVAISIAGYFVYCIAESADSFDDRIWYAGFVPLLVFTAADFLFVGRAKSAYPTTNRKAVLQFRTCYRVIRVLFFACLVTPILAAFVYLGSIVVMLYVLLISAVAK